MLLDKPIITLAPHGTKLPGKRQEDALEIVWYDPADPHRYRSRFGRC